MANSKTIEDMLKSGTLMKGNDPKLEVKRISTGWDKLDEALGNGIALGRFYLIVGDPSSGKTYLSQKISQQILTDPENFIEYVDLEYVYDRMWWESCGLDVERVLVTRPSSGEAAVDIIIDSIKAGVKLVIIDSIPGLTPQAVVDEGADYNPMANVARLVSANLPKIVAAAAHNGAIVLGINQKRDSMKLGQPETYPGGWAQRFYSSTIIRVRSNGWIRENDKRVGFKMSLECTKNKIGEPYKTCEVDFRFDGGMDFMGLDIAEFLEKELIKRAGPYYKWEANSLMGINSLRQFFLDNPVEYERLKGLIL